MPTGRTGSTRSKPSSKKSSTKGYAYWGRKFLLTVLGMFFVAGGMRMVDYYEIGEPYYKWYVIGIVGLVGGFSMINGGLSIADMIRKNGQSKPKA